MNLDEHYILPDWPAPSNILCCSTKRRGGNSQAPYHSFNLAAHVGDRINDVIKNRDKLVQDWGLISDPCWLEQHHGTFCLNLDNTAADQRADAATTTQLHTPCAVMTADCLPILICNKQGTEIAAIHAGWRGLAAGIINSTIQQCQSAPESLLAWLGPAIGVDAFTINADIKQLFINKDIAYRQGFSGCDQNLRANIIDLARINLEMLGINQIYGGIYCTYQNPKHFFSYRRNRQTGRMASLICITDSTNTQPKK